MKAVLLLEDDPQRVEYFQKWFPDQIHHEETAAGAIQALKDKNFDAIFLDHDLGGEIFVDQTNTNTGSEVVRFLVDYDGPNKGADYIVHSLNFPAAKWMVEQLQGAGFPRALQLPFTALLVQPPTWREATP